MTVRKKLYRSRSNRKIAGVCGGLGEYFDIDPTLIRLAVVFFTLWWGGGLLAYFIAWFVIPDEPVVEDANLLTDAAKEMQPAETLPPESAKASDTPPEA